VVLSTSVDSEGGGKRRSDPFKVRGGVRTSLVIGREDPTEKKRTTA